MCWSMRAGGAVKALINKDDAPVSVDLPARVSAQAMRLSGPALDSKVGTASAMVSVVPRTLETVVVEGHTGMIYEICEVRRGLTNDDFYQASEPAEVFWQGRVRLRLTVDQAEWLGRSCGCGTA